MATEDYDSNNHRSGYDHDHNRHLQRDVHEAHTDAKVAKLLATLAIITAAIALAMSLWALDKAGEAQSTANRATETARQSAP